MDLHMGAIRYRARPDEPDGARRLEVRRAHHRRATPGVGFASVFLPARGARRARRSDHRLQRRQLPRARRACAQRDPAPPSRMRMPRGSSRAIAIMATGFTIVSWNAGAVLAATAADVERGMEAAVAM